MSTNCANRWIIRGDFSTRCQLVERVETQSSQVRSPLDFNKIIPLAYNNISLQSELWGTKWNAYNVFLEHDEQNTTYTFLTTLSPPYKKLILTAMNLFPGLEYEFLYVEGKSKSYGRHGTHCKDYRTKFRWKKKDPDQGSDFMNPYDSDDDKEWEPVLIPTLSQFQELYDMSR